MRVGLRPGTDDELPIVGRSATMPRVFYATGHFRNGVLLAPLTASLVADLVLDGREGPGMELMRPAPGRPVRPSATASCVSRNSIARARSPSLTGLSARQLQWWDSRRLFTSAVASQRTEAGGYTERRYTPLDVLELQVLADLRRRGFSIPRLRHLLDTLRDVFRIRLYEAIGDGGPMTLFVGGDQIFARAQDGRLFNLDDPTQPLLMVGEELPLRPVTARERERKPPARRRGAAAANGASRSEKSSRGRRPDAE